MQNSLQGNDARSGRFAVLLDDPVFDNWAAEIAGAYGVSEHHALEALAEALTRDSTS
jgi:DNA-binding SARP family transcriptional activator